MVDKHQAMIDYLLTCPQVRDNPLFFNFGEARENNNQFITTSNSETYGVEYIDGSRLKYYAFTLLTFKAISYNAVVKTGGKQDENLTEMTEFQEIIDWISDQDDAGNYPDFGEDCQVDNIVCLTANPVLSDVDASMEPAIATYTITIRVVYLDNSKKIWK